MQHFPFYLVISPHKHTLNSKVYIPFSPRIKMNKSLLLEFLGDNPLFRIIDFLIENKGLDVTKKEIIEGTGISRAALFKYWGRIESQDIVIVTRRFGKTKLYQLNTGNPIIRKLLELESALIGKALDKRALKEVAV